MARATATVTVEDEGRDKGRTFYLTEMPAAQAEAWAIRALQGVCRARGDVPPSFVIAWGILGVLGYRALQAMSYADVKPLLDEMMECVHLLPTDNPNLKAPLSTNPPEEVQTLLKLRKAVWDLHAGPWQAVALSVFRDFGAAADETSGDTSTSPKE